MNSGRTIFSQLTQLPSRSGVLPVTGPPWEAAGLTGSDNSRRAKRNGYHYAVSLETHWRGAGTAEASTRQSWAGMKKELQEAGALQDYA